MSDSQIFLPLLKTDDPELDKAFSIASGNIISSIHILQNGLLDAPAPLFCAGACYPTPWTRDAAFNSWYAGTFFSPAIAKNTLRAVLNNAGNPMIDEDLGQYWDMIVWTWGAWNYYLISGDKEFLQTALTATENTLAYLYDREFDSADGLFRGGACFQDGIAGYPDRFLSNAKESGILHCLQDEPRHEYLSPVGGGLSCKALSTNCLYKIAYDCAAQMRQILGQPENPLWAERSAALAQAINNRFWNEELGCYEYLLDAGDTQSRQEGLGAAFAILSGVAAGDKAEKLVKNMHRTPHGIPAVWPQYERYALYRGAYARHSGVVWPQVTAAWTGALADTGRRQEAMKELKLLTQKAARDAVFYEIYHPETGKPYGGLQENGVHGLVEWESCICQTWAATGYVYMVLKTLFGMKAAPQSIEFAPALPEGVDRMTLSGLHYRGGEIEIKVSRGAAASGPQSVSGDCRGKVCLQFTCSA